jgi:hypothetical protein
MNINNIFSVFTPQEDIKINNLSQLSDFKIGMFYKFIVNFEFSKEKFIEIIGKDLGVDKNEMKEIGREIIYNIAFSYIEELDINTEECVEALSKYKKRNLDFYLTLNLKYFEEKEEYRKCVILKKILDKVKEIS